MMTRKRNVFVDGKVYVRRRQCSSCIFGPRTPIGSERLAEMVAKAGHDGCIPCHHHLDEDLNPVCGGFFKKVYNSILQVAERLDLIEWVEGDPWDDGEDEGCLTTR